jgi:hypothetical protein
MKRNRRFCSVALRYSKADNSCGRFVAVGGQQRRAVGGSAMTLGPTSSLADDYIKEKLRLDIVLNFRPVMELYTRLFVS